HATAGGHSGGWRDLRSSCGYRRQTRHPFHDDVNPVLRPPRCRRCARGGLHERPSGSPSRATESAGRRTQCTLIITTFDRTPARELFDGSLGLSGSDPKFLLRDSSALLSCSTSARSLRGSVSFATSSHNLRQSCSSICVMASR